jgi:hypothetical protein
MILFKAISITANGIKTLHMEKQNKNFWMAPTTKEIFFMELKVVSDIMSATPEFIKADL